MLVEAEEARRILPDVAALGLANYEVDLTGPVPGARLDGEQLVTGPGGAGWVELALPRKLLYLGTLAKPIDGRLISTLRRTDGSVIRLGSKGDAPYRGSTAVVYPGPEVQST